MHFSFEHIQASIQHNISSSFPGRLCQKWWDSKEELYQEDARKLATGNNHNNVLECSVSTRFSRMNLDHLSYLSLLVVKRSKNKMVSGCFFLVKQSKNGIFFFCSYINLHFAQKQVVLWREVSSQGAQVQNQYHLKAESSGWEHAVHTFRWNRPYTVCKQCKMILINLFTLIIIYRPRYKVSTYSPSST